MVKFNDISLETSDVISSKDNSNTVVKIRPKIDKCVLQE